VVWKVAKWVEGVKKIGHSASKTMTCPSCHNETGIGTRCAVRSRFHVSEEMQKCGKEFLIRAVGKTDRFENYCLCERSIPGGPSKGGRQHPFSAS